MYVRLGCILNCGNKFYTKLQAQLDAGKTLQVTANQRGCPTRAEDLAAHLLTGIAEAKLESGVSRFCGNEEMTRLEFARSLFKNHLINYGKNLSPKKIIRPKTVILK